MFYFEMTLFSNIAVLVLLMMMAHLRKIYKEFAKDIELNNALYEICDCIRKYEENNVENVDKFEKLVQKYPDVINVHFGAEGYTPFLMACKSGATDLVECMIKHGANLVKTNYYGEGPMFLATYYVLNNRYQLDVKCLWLLYHSGCNINEKSFEGYTPLHLAAARGYKRLINWLVKKEADPNILPLPAGIALSNGYNEAAALILQHVNGSLSHVN